MSNPTQALQAVKPDAGPVGSALPAEEIRTSAQARVDAVADLLAGAYARASTLKLSDEDCQRLTEEFPDDAVYKGAKGDETLLYVSHAYMRDRLNSVFGPGRWALVQRRLWGEDFRTAKSEPATRLYAECILLVKGCYVGEAIGAMVYYPNNPKSDYSEASEGAQSEALRRICQKSLGIGLQVYKKDWCEAWKERQRKGIKREARQGFHQQSNEPPPSQVKEPLTPRWPVESWLPKTVTNIEARKTTTGRDYKLVKFDAEENQYSCFHALQGVKSGDKIWVVTESKEKAGVVYHNLADWQPDKGEALEEHKQHLLKRIAEEGQPIADELLRLGQEKSWLIPNIEGIADLPLRFVPRSVQACEELIGELKTRLGA